MSTGKVWFVTGASKGLGRSLVNQLLAKGFKVAATSRDAAAFQKQADENFLPLSVSLTDEGSVKSAIAQTVDHFGRIDVVVNNAGYGQVGALEELTDAEVRGNFDVNVFGLLNVIREAMPYLRTQQSGHIINIASLAGFTGGFPGWGIYCATKFAVVGLTEALREEIKAFGVHATVVSPGYFRTDFLTGGSLAVSAREIPGYQAVRDTIKFHENMNGNQPGDPEKGVAAIIEMAASPNPPLNFLLGQDAYEGVPLKFHSVLDEIEQWKELTVNTVY